MSEAAMMEVFICSLSALPHTMKAVWLAVMTVAVVRRGIISMNAILWRFKTMPPDLMS